MMPSKKEQAAKILEEAGFGEPLSPPPPSDGPVKSLAGEKAAFDDAPDTQEAHEDVEDDDAAATLADIAELMGVDITELYDVQINMGKEPPSSIGKLKDAERRARELEKRLRGLEQEHEQDQKELTNLRTQGAAPFGGMPPELDQLRLRALQWHEYVYQNSGFWDQLKDEEPAQYAAELTKAQMTAQQVANQFRHEFAAWQQQQQQQMKDLQRQQRKKLAETDAAWADDTIRAERYKTISDWLRDGNAAVPDNLSDVLTDPGWANRLYEAAAAAQGVKNAEKGTPRKVGTAKLRRGALRRGGSSTGKLTDLIKHAKQTGKASDKRAAGEAILTGVFQKAGSKE